MIALPRGCEEVEEEDQQQELTSGTKMMVSDEEKRWIVVGIAMNKVAAPVLRDAIKQGMDTNYANLDRYCQLLTPPSTLKTLTYSLVRADPVFRRLKFKNINNNHLVHGVCNYNFNINSSVDLAKLYLPDYLAQFSAFDDSLDMTAILRLLGCKNYMPAIVFSPHTQASADDVRENVRNKWGHVDVTEWTDALFNNCCDKLKTLVRSLGLTAGVEKNTLDQLGDWQTKGCHFIMGHAVDKDLLRLVQGKVKGLIKDYNTIESQLNLQNERVAKVEEDVAIFKDQSRKVLERLLSFEAQIALRLQAAEEKVDQLEQSQTKTDDRVEKLEQRQTNTADEVELLKHSRINTADEVELLKHSHTKTADEVELLKHSYSKTADEVELLKHSYTETTAKVDQLDQRCAEVEQIRQELKPQRDKPEASSMKPFDLESCRSKLEGHYQKTATVPTSVWSRKSLKDIHEIYTRLSFVKGSEQTPAGTTQSELKHYSDLFTAKKNGVIPKRIIVQGQTGIGKSTFVKKLLVDWVEVNKGTGDEQAAVLKNFELVVAVNLKEVSKCQSLRDVIRLSNVFAKEDKYMAEGLVNYITNNQEKVLLVFDGYDEYHSGRDSEIYEIFRGNSLRSCCVLITTRISKADELRGGEDLHAEITGFSEVDREYFMRRFLGSKEVSDLQDHLYRRNLNELAKVPLLLLFFCTLWKRGQSKHFPKTKTRLFLDIVQFILNHSHSKQSTSQYVEVASFKEILSEIGKVALQGLLNDDHLFEYSQLSDSVRCEESVFIGLLQIAEYSETLRPVGMVSFIHKSIQEFLAAWYVTYRCIAEGGNLGEIGVNLEECLALENVFQFICGLSQGGAFAAFRHLKSVRISDPSLDLFETVPDVENGTDVPVSDVTERQWQFSDLVLDLFEGFESKADLLSPCLDCLGTVLPVFLERPLPKDLLLKAKDANALSLVFGKRQYSVGPTESVQILNKVVKMLVTESPEILKVADFLEKFLRIPLIYCECGFFSVLCFRNDQVYFYITRLTLSCKDHVKLFSDNVVPSHTVHLHPERSILKFLKILKCPTFSYSMKGLGAVIKHCNHLERVKISRSNNSLHCLLEQVPNPRRCSLSIRSCNLSSIGAVKLASLLPSFETVTNLNLCLAKCSTRAATRLVNAIKHKTLKELELSGLRLMSPRVGQSMPEIQSALRILKISCLPGCSAEAVSKLVATIKHKSLEELVLSEIPLTSVAAEMFCHWLPGLPALRTLTMSGLPVCYDDAVAKFIHTVKHKTLERLTLREVNLTSAVVEALGQSLPELSALQTLEISGSDGCSLYSEFENINSKFMIIGGLTDCFTEAITTLISPIKLKTLERLVMHEINLTSSVAEVLGRWLSKVPGLRKLTISGSAECSDEAVARVVSAIKHKTLEELKLSEMHLTTAAADVIGLSLPELSALRRLKISGMAECSDDSVTRLFAAIKQKTLEELEVSEINLTPGAAEALGQTLPELSALRTLTIIGLTEYSDDALTKLVAAMKHKTLQVLKLGEINLTLAVVEALGQSLPELSALDILDISCSDGCRLQLDIPLFIGDFNSLTVRGLTECSVEGVTRLVAAIEHKTLEDLEQNEIYSASTKAFLTLERSAFTDCSAEAVTKLLATINHKTLTVLKLGEMHLTSAAAEALGQLLPELSVLRTLKITGLAECSDSAVTTLVAAIKHKTLEKLVLSQVNLTSAVAVALGQSLPELSALRAMKIIGSDGCSFQFRFPDFGGDLKPLTIHGLTECSAEAVTRMVAAIKHNILEELELSKIYLASKVAEELGQSVRESPALPTLEIRDLAKCSAEAVIKLLATIVTKQKTFTVLELSEINLTSAAAAALGQSLPALSALRILRISDLAECSDEAVTKLVAAIKHKALEELKLSKIHLTSAVAEVLGQSLPELPALQTLKISGSDGYSLQHKEMEALFGGFSKPSPLKELCITCFSARGSLAPLAKKLSLFPFLVALHLEDLDMCEADLSGVLENLKFLPNLRRLHLGGNPLRHTVRLMVPYLSEQQNLESVIFRRGDCSIRDVYYVQSALKENHLS